MHVLRKRRKELDMAFESHMKELRELTQKLEQGNLPLEEAIALYTKGMELTAAHLRYLLAIYEVSQTHLDISSRSIAEKLGVTKPSVVRIMNLLMERGMIVKEHYGKIYMTDRGIFVAKEVQAQLERVLQNFPPVNIELTEEERFAAALALT